MVAEKSTDKLVTVWSGTVAFNNGKYWTERIPVSVRGSSAHVGAAKAVACAKRKLGRGKRIAGVSVQLMRSTMVEVR